MSKLYVIMGKSSSGKDTIFNLLVDNEQLKLNRIVPYTTRPIRKDEIDTVHYNFVDIDTLNKLKRENKVVEHRSYNTEHGIWHYFTGAVELDKDKKYIIIGTIESFINLKEYYGSDIVVPIYIEVDDGVRIQRALDREKVQEHPKFKEMCRRYLKDEEDFSYENTIKAGIKDSHKYINHSIDDCLRDIISDINIDS